jgi:hypothetical protein
MANYGTRISKDDPCCFTVVGIGSIPLILMLAKDLTADREKED